MISRGTEPVSFMAARSAPEATDQAEAEVTQVGFTTRVLAELHPVPVHVLDQRKQLGGMACLRHMPGNVTGLVG